MATRYARVWLPSGSGRTRRAGRRLATSRPPCACSRRSATSAAESAGVVSMSRPTCRVPSSDIVTPAASSWRATPPPSTGTPSTTWARYSWPRPGSVRSSSRDVTTSSRLRFMESTAPSHCLSMSRAVSYPAVTETGPGCCAATSCPAARIAAAATVQVRADRWRGCMGSALLSRPSWIMRLRRRRSGCGYRVAQRRTRSHLARDRLGPQLHAGRDWRPAGDGGRAGPSDARTESAAARSRSGPYVHRSVARPAAVLSARRPKAQFSTSGGPSTTVVHGCDGP